MKSKDNFKVIGVMSGTSLDGLDLACCQFERRRKKWKFSIAKAVTLKYTKRWKEALTNAPGLSAADLLALDTAYGKFIGEACLDFAKKKKIKNVDFIASHGHTIFHQPATGFTFQLGNGNAVHAASGLPVVYDFRQLDVALEGQGAPLVPIGDRHLFGRYAICLNLGGIANVSLEKGKKRIAYDVCFVNMGLNYLAVKGGQELDRDGILAGNGHVHAPLLAALKRAYAPYRKNRPSLAREDFEKSICHLLDDETLSLEDRLRTFCESAGDEIALGLGNRKKKSTMLVTGGGALNPVLMKILRGKLPRVKLATAPRKIIEFKEALVFAFLGVLRVRGEVNVLKSVTRASADSSCGSIVGYRR